MKSPVHLALLTAGIAVAAFALTPVVYLLIRALQAGDEAFDFLRRPLVREVFANSALLATIVAAGSLALGVPIAWLAVRTDLPGRRFWTIASVLPLAMPSYIAAYAFMGFLGSGGPVAAAFRDLGVERWPEFAYGLSGTATVLTLINYPFVVLGVRAALQRTDPAIEEAARGLGAGRIEIFRRVLLPQLRPAMTAGALLVALYSLGDFGTPALMRFRSFTRVIYTQYSNSFDRTVAATTALVLAALTATVLVAETMARGRANLHRTAPATQRPVPLVRLGRWKWPAIGFLSATLAASVGLPVVAMIVWIVEGASRGTATFVSGRVAWNSVLNAGLAAVATVLAAFPAAWLAVRRPGRATALVDRASYAGNALPGIVVALAFVFMGSRIPWLYQTLPLLVAAYVVRFLPQALASIRTSLMQFNPRLEEAGQSLGRSRWFVFRTVTLPLLAPGILAGGSLVFLTTIKELPITLLLRPTGREHDTLVTEVWSAAQDSLFSQASPPALLLVIVSGASIALILRRERTGASA